MKKVFALLLVFLFLGAIAIADYDKDIQFAGFAFGTTFDEIQKIEPLEYMSWEYSIRPSYEIANSFGRSSTNFAHSFDVELGVGRYAGGFEASAILYFNFPISEGRVIQDLGSATLYGGAYKFEMWKTDNPPTFDGLLSKLIGVYGEPSLQTENPEEVWELSDDMDLDDWYPDAVYNIAVWQSSANGVKVILYEYNTWGYDRSNIEIYYLCPAYDEAILSLDLSLNGSNDSVDHL